MPEPRALVLCFTRTLDARQSRGADAAAESEESTTTLLRLARESDDVESADQRDFARWVDEARSKPDEPIILDLSGSSYANSARISVMLKLWRAAGPERQMSIVAPDPLLANVLKRCHVDRLIPMYTSLADARAALPPT